MLKPISIHLPQFHPIKENDEWWGKGFTEWTNVTKAKPLFKGHYQPHLPADLGFYDLRLEEARMAQIELAKAYGIYGFCYYHYWFNGKRLLEEPLTRMLKNKQEDFPFMLCWANENWSRRWDGMDQEVLIEQHYSPKDDVAHIRFLIEHYFNDERYIKIDNKPFILIYRIGLLPNIKDTVRIWKEEALKAGFNGLHIGYMCTFNQLRKLEDDIFDCAVDFQPNLWDVPTQQFAPIKDKIKTKIGFEKSPYYLNKIISYSDYVDHVISKYQKNKNIYPGISPGWDNSPRRKENAIILKDAKPEYYGKWLSFLNNEYKNENTFLFINAWNEWAEGNHLEPCQKWGNTFLEVTKTILT